MLEDTIYDKDFALLMQKNIKDIIGYFFKKNRHFGILCNIENVTFNPPLPDEITKTFHSVTLFFLAGYTFEVARVEDNYLIFEAGFGPDNFGSVVTVPLLDIVQIIVDETPVFINLSKYIEEKNIDDINEDAIQNSMNIFLSNPENIDFLK